MSSKVSSTANALKLICNTQVAVYLIFPFVLGKLGNEGTDFRQDIEWKSYG